MHNYILFSLIFIKHGRKTPLIMEMKRGKLRFIIRQPFHLFPVSLPYFYLLLSLLNSKLSYMSTLNMAQFRTQSCKWKLLRHAKVITHAQ
jgi:hypothetical protein